MSYNMCMTLTQPKCYVKSSKAMTIKLTSLPYFSVKLSCVCLMFAYRKKKIMTYSDPIMTYSHPKMTYSYPKVT